MFSKNAKPPIVPVGVMDEERHPDVYRIERLDEVRSYIAEIDFTHLKKKFCCSPPGAEGGLGWSMTKADAVEGLYKNWLFLRRKYEEVLPPSPDIDQFWHGHILDTRAYQRDCARIFGTYHHHFPYFGDRSDQDRAELIRAWERTLQLYEYEFGELIYEIQDEAERITNSHSSRTL